MQKIKVLAILLILLQTLGCETEIGPFSPIPKLSLSSIDRVLDPDGKDSIIIIDFSFTDGDGDLGLSDADTGAPFNTPPYNNNLYINVKEVKNGVLDYLIDPIIMDTFRLQSRMPVITPTSKTKAIDGDFTLNIPVAFAPGLEPDSVLFEVFVYDRSLNKSNVLTTPVLRIDR